MTNEHEFMKPVTQDMPTAEMIEALTERINYLNKEFAETEHPWANTDREGTRRRAAEELATLEFRLHARINDLRAQQKRWEDAIVETIITLGNLHQMSSDLATLRKAYYATA